MVDGHVIVLVGYFMVYLASLQMQFVFDTFLRQTAAWHDFPFMIQYRTKSENRKVFLTCD